MREWKEHGRRRLAHEAATLVAEVVPRLEVMALAHVPGDPERAWERGHVPPRALAEALADIWQVASIDVLARTRSIPRQRGLALADRRSNVRRSVVARGRSAESVCLVDDVYTSGATADACAAALKSAGAHEVEVVTFARAVR